MRHQNEDPPASLTMRRATIVDVATAAGVSKQTVTRAMNDMPGIKAETRQRIRKIAQELDYVPSRFAKGLAQGTGTSLGLAVPGLSNPYFPSFVSSVVEQATKRGWQVVINDYGDGAVDPVSAIAQLAPNVDVVIGWLGDEHGASQKALGRRPLVLLDLADAGAAGEVTFDYTHAAQLALDHLRAQGHKKIVYLVYVRHQGLSVRAQAFARYAGEQGLPLTFKNSKDSAFGARQAVINMLESGTEPDAIITFNDVMAIGTIKALTQMGRLVPRDCAVIGMDGIPLGELFMPELSSLSIDFKETGAAAVQLAERLLSGQTVAGTPDAKTVLKHKLCLRQSG